MRDCLNWLEESRNFSAGVLQADPVNKTISIAGRGLESQILCVSLHSCLPVMAKSTSLVFLLYRPVSAWSDIHNVLITFLVYLSIHTYAVKYPKQNQWFEKWWNKPSMVQFTLPSAKTPLHDAFGFRRPFLQLLYRNTPFISL